MIVELLVASLAVLLWTPGSSRLVDRMCVDLALLAGGHTLLFNLNPLMRFDGYFMLADLLGITNLAAEEPTTSRAYAGIGSAGLSCRHSTSRLVGHGGLLLMDCWPLCGEARCCWPWSWA